MSYLDIIGDVIGDPVGSLSDGLSDGMDTVTDVYTVGTRAASTAVDAGTRVPGIVVEEQVIAPARETVGRAVGEKAGQAAKWAGGLILGGGLAAAGGWLARKYLFKG